MKLLDKALSPLELIYKADAIGIRLEIIRGLPVWEASPSYRHQTEIDRIRASIRSNQSTDCPCIHVSDVVIRFPDDSLKRPDISIFCSHPPESEHDEAISQIPEAVVEIISPGYESKDTDIAPSFYLMHGVKDVLIFDPRSKMVWHHRKNGIERLVSPVQRLLECGCECVV
jgi:Uma2 family endonuclease